MTDFINEALRQMASDGLIVVDPVADGQLHRCAVQGRERSKSGAYLIHADDMPVAWWRNWRTDVEDTCSGKPEKELSKKERKAYQERVKAMKEAARLDAVARHKEAADKAAQEWAAAMEATNEHPYLKRKEVEAFGLRVNSKGNLLMPVLAGDGKIVSLQYIFPKKLADGRDKSFLTGAQKKGCYFPIPARDNAKKGPLLIAEGYATGASLHMATGHAVLVALDAGNLLSVAKMARAKYPARKICLCGDYDIPSDDTALAKYPEPGGIGAAKAKEAAMAVGGYVAISPAIDGGKSDWNDIHCRDGLLTVQDLIEKALRGGPVTDCPLPPGFRIVKDGRHAGLYFMKEASDGTTEDIRLGPPLEVLSFTRDDDGKDWGLMLAWLDHDGNRHEWAMPLSLLYGQSGEWFPLLAYGGWLGNPSCRKYIGSFLSSVRPLRRLRCVNNTGWSGNRYVLPGRVYGNGGEDDLVLQSLCHEGLYQVAGNMEAWEEAARHCVGNSRLGFALCCAFAGPLLRIAGMEGGGFSFEGASSSGKTTALRVAASVWGGDCHLRGWRATDNALEAVAALHNDNLLVLDELSQVRARVLDEAVYMLANGAGKTRASRDGGLRKSYRWRSFILSSGELGLADKLAEDGRRARAGQEVRLCGIQVEKSHISELHGMDEAGKLVRHINELCAANYGHAGRMFLDLLARPETLEKTRETLHARIEKEALKMCPKGADGQVVRVAMRFALAGIAGDMAVWFAILPDTFQAMEYARICFEDWLDKRGGAGAAEDKAILDQVRLIIERDGASRFQDVNLPDELVRDRLGFVDRQDGTTEYIILPQQFRNVFASGFSERRAASILRAAGWLEVGNQGRNKTRRTLPNMGRQEVYVLHMPENI